MFRVRDEGLRSEDISYGKSKEVNFKQPIKLGRYHNFVRQHEQKIKLFMKELVLLRTKRPVTLCTE